MDGGLQKQRVDTCVVHGEESLLHEQMLQVLIGHWDLSHHVTRHITGETTGLPVVETVGVFVSEHLTSAETGSYCDFISGFGRKRNVCVCICMLQR